MRKTVLKTSGKGCIQIPNRRRSRVNEYVMICQITVVRREGNMKLIAFILLIIGTTGLLLNELIFDWGRVTTLIFAASNLMGFAILVFSYWRTKGKK